MTAKGFASLLAVSMCSLAVSGADYTLADNGKPNARIQSNPNPAAPEFMAVTELQEYIRKISGAHVKRTTYPGVFWRSTSDTPETVEILPVTLENGKHLLPDAVKAKLEATDNPDAFYIKSDASGGKFIFIAGKTPQAVLYGTLAFIEDYLGVRWFHAGEEGEYCPKNKTIRLGEIDDFRQPWMAQRTMGAWTKSVLPFDFENFETWLTRSKYNWNINHAYSDKTRLQLDKATCGNKPIGGGGHLTFEQAVPKKLFAAHPEYFPLKKDKRVCEERSQRCLSNPAVQKMVIDYVTRHTAYGGKYSISYHDSTDGWCMCPECVKMGTGDTTGKFSYTTLAHRFSSLVSEAVLKRNPDAKLTYDMYSQFRPFPDIKGFQYDKRMLGVYCPHQRCYVHAFDDPNSDCNKFFHDEFMRWKKLGTKIGFFEYYCSANSPYTPMEYVLAKDMQFFKKMNFTSWHEDCTYPDAQYPLSNWPLYWAAAKLMWNADLDIGRLMDEAYTLYYGAAAEPMKKYQKYRRELWETAPGHALYGGPKRYAYCLTVPGAEKRLLGYLEEAKKLADGDRILLKRIGNDEFFLKKYWIAGAEELKKVSAGQNHIPVAKANGKITIDGVLDEDAWRGASFVTGFKDMKTKEEPIEETRIRVLYDSDNWYVGIEAMTEHAWGKLVANTAERDGNVWQDDSVETFFQPPNTGDSFQLIVNSVGTLWDGKMHQKDQYDSKAEIKTRVLKDRYVIEMRVPIKPMGRDAIANGEVWKMHFYRNIHNLQPPNNTEGIGLDATPPHEQTRYRSAAVGKNVFMNGNFAEVAPVKENEKKNYTSPEFVKHWSGNSVGIVKGANNRNTVEMKHWMASWMDLTPARDYPQILRGEIAASGKGALDSHISGCVRKPDDKKAFGHEIKLKVIEKGVLSDKMQTFPFEVEIPPYFQGYVYLYSPDAKIDYITGSLSPKK